MVGNVSGVLRRYQRSIDVQANFYRICMHLRVFVIILCDLNQLISEHCFQEKHCDMVVVVSAPAEQQPGGLRC